MELYYHCRKISAKKIKQFQDETRNIGNISNISFGGIRCSTPLLEKVNENISTDIPINSKNSDDPVRSILSIGESGLSECMSENIPHHLSNDHFGLDEFVESGNFGCNCSRNASPISVEKVMFTKNKITVKDKSNGVTTPEAIGVTPEKSDVPNCLNLSFEENPKIEPSGVRNVKKLPSKTYNVYILEVVSI
ncbi:hypothetical protein JTB14_035352 [Gonioctena quinquepunctata]|nr:hypothetical protein JTB14_035352 [Gonioctena quinquepunctata]